MARAATMERTPMKRRWASVMPCLLLAAACRAAPAAPAKAPASTTSGATAAPPAAPTRPAAAVAPTGAPAALTTVRVGVLGGQPDAPFFIAQERGYLRD